MKKKQIPFNKFTQLQLAFKITFFQICHLTINKYCVSLYLKSTVCLFKSKSKYNNKKASIRGMLNIIRHMKIQC